MDANGNFPINAHLLRLILVGALYFNQLLVWAVSSVLIHQERLVTAKRLSKVDLILAVAVWVSILVVQKCEHVFRRKDLALALLSAVIMATVVLRDLSPLPTLAAVNAALLIWNFRSVFRRAAENGSVEKV
ncbi:MAG TPA: hypothetical protein VFT72_14600 [Opitutaceae bacterium]|nr:hypothetical protein [Opitutaceae bacterium]